MFTNNPFEQLAGIIPPDMMQAYVILMVIFVIGGTIIDMMHKKSAKYFFQNSEKAKKSATRTVSGGEKASLAINTLTSEVLTSSEFANTKRRISHLLTMYGFILFVVTTAILIFGENASDLTATLWHIGALMLCVGGYWFWFDIRVDVSAEGKKWYQISPRGDMFILSLLATCTFALLWSFTGSMLLFVLFIVSSTILFGGVIWSKFAHMFFKPAAAFQKKVTKADGSRENLPGKFDLTSAAVQEQFPDIPEYMGKNPEDMGLGIKRESPRHY